MKKSLPANAKISKEAKETVQECVSEFISFITGEASDKCQREKRKTINGDDLLWAMTTLGFENYVGPLKIYLNKYRETEGEKNSMARQDDQNQTAAGIAEMNRINHSLSVAKTGFQNFNMGFYSLDTEAFPKNSTVGEVGGGGAGGYGENFGGGGYNMSRIHENGDGNGGRAAGAMAAHVHGVDW